MEEGQKNKIQKMGQKCVCVRVCGAPKEGEGKKWEIKIRMEKGMDVGEERVQVNHTRGGGGGGAFL